MRRDIGVAAVAAARIDQIIVTNVNHKISFHYITFNRFICMTSHSNAIISERMNDFFLLHFVCVSVVQTSKLHGIPWDSSNRVRRKNEKKTTTRNNLNAIIIRQLFFITSYTFFSLCVFFVRVWCFTRSALMTLSSLVYFLFIIIIMIIFFQLGCTDKIPNLYISNFSTCWHLKYSL